MTRRAKSVTAWNHVLGRMISAPTMLSAMHMPFVGRVWNPPHKSEAHPSGQKAQFSLDSNVSKPVNRIPKRLCASLLSRSEGAEGGRFITAIRRPLHSAEKSRAKSSQNSAVTFSSPVSEQAIVSPFDILIIIIILRIAEEWYNYDSINIFFFKRVECGTKR